MSKNVDALLAVQRHHADHVGVLRVGQPRAKQIGRGLARYRRLPIEGAA